MFTELVGYAKMIRSKEELIDYLIPCIELSLLSLVKLDVPSLRKYGLIICLYEDGAWVPSLGAESQHIHAFQDL